MRATTARPSVAARGEPLRRALPFPASEPSPVVAGPAKPRLGPRHQVPSLFVPHTPRASHGASSYLCLRSVLGSVGHCWMRDRYSRRTHAPAGTGGVSGHQRYQSKLSRAPFQLRMRRQYNCHRRQPCPVLRHPHAVPLRPRRVRNDPDVHACWLLGPSCARDSPRADVSALTLVCPCWAFS